MMPFGFGFGGPMMGPPMMGPPMMGPPMMGPPMMGPPMMMPPPPMMLGGGGPFGPMVFGIPGNARGTAQIWKSAPTKKVGKLTLYHVTDQKSAGLIKQSGKMLRGKDGWFGGGIYFGKTKSDCLKKAHHGRQDPYYIKALVDMGKAVMLNVRKNGAPCGKQDITYSRLKSHGKCNSVLAYNIQTGNEYIVYNHARVKILSIKDKNGKSV